MIKFANIDRYGACSSICGHAPIHYGGFVMIGSYCCTKMCPYFKMRFKILFWDFVVCDPEQKRRVEEPYIL